MTARSSITASVGLVLVLAGFFVTGLGTARGAEIKTRVIDGLAQPLPGAAVEVRLTQKAPDGKVTNVHWLKLTADREGRVNGGYDEKREFADNFQISLAGYSGYSTGLRTEYVLQRKVGAKDLRRAARSKGEAQNAALRELLAGDYELKNSDEIFNDLVLFHYQDIRPALRALISDPSVGTRAAEALSFIGVPEDLRLIVQFAQPPKRESFGNRWAYQVVSSLFEPQTEEEWGFLKKCAFNEYDDLWVDAGAIGTLRLISSPRSLEILKEARNKNRGRRREIDEAVRYVESNPSPLSGTNLVEVAKSVAQALQISKWEGNKEPRLNDEGDMAFVDCEFVAGRDRFIYTATFHRVAGVWKLRGVRETSQALMAYPPDRKLFVGVWHGFSSSHLEFARLELRQNGTGFMFISGLPDSPPDPYRVTRWSVRGFEAEITIEPAQPDAEPITLQHVIYGIQSLELELQGKGWSRKMTLFNEADFTNRANAAKTSLDGVSKTQ